MKWNNYLSESAWTSPGSGGGWEWTEWWFCEGASSELVTSCGLPSCSSGKGSSSSGRLPASVESV